MTETPTSDRVIVTEPMTVSVNALALGCLGIGVVGIFAAVLGAAVVWIALGRSAPSPPAPLPTPTPNPAPTPNPLPAPVPITQTFAARVATAFTQEGGTKNEAQILGAMFSQFAESLAIDGQLANPLTKTTNDLGRVLAQMQQLRGVQWGQRFALMRGVIAAELTGRGIIDQTKSQPLDAMRRASAVQLFSEVGTALTGAAG